MKEKVHVAQKGLQIITVNGKYNKQKKTLRMHIATVTKTKQIAGIRGSTSTSLVKNKIASINSIDIKRHGESQKITLPLEYVLSQKTK